MKKNMGIIDRSIRILIAVIIAGLYYTDYLTGTLGIILLAFALIFVITSLISFCPLYYPFKIRTNKRKKEE